MGEDADVLMALYDAKEGKFLRSVTQALPIHASVSYVIGDIQSILSHTLPSSENYVMKWGNQGMPKDLDQLNNLRVVFTVSASHVLYSHASLERSITLNIMQDLGTKDTTRERVHLLCQVIRVGQYLLHSLLLLGVH